MIYKICLNQGGNHRRWKNAKTRHKSKLYKNNRIVFEWSNL